MKANENYIDVYNDKLTEEDKDAMVDVLKGHFYEILKEMKFDVDNDQQIQDTPRRIAKMWVKELCQGCYDPPPKITVFENTNNYDQMIFLGPIEVKSLCSHHFQNFIGKAYIAYIPDQKIIGISKLARIVKWFMRRPQIQEELTKQITSYIEEKLCPQGCAVYIEATHLCMVARGVEENQKALMKTSDLRGCFKDAEVKLEFLSMIK